MLQKAPRMKEPEPADGPDSALSKDPTDSLLCDTVAIGLPQAPASSPAMIGQQRPTRAKRQTNGRRDAGGTQTNLSPESGEGTSEKGPLFERIAVWLEGKESETQPKVC
jgi:hypothetical protein